MTDMPSPHTAPTKIVSVRQTRTWIWTALSIAGALAALLLLSTIDNADGTPWLESTLIGQTLALLGVVAAAFLPSLISTRKDAAVVRDQLENSHVDNPQRVSNVRENIDSNHIEILKRLDRFETRVDRRFDGMASDIRGVRRDIGRHADAIADLEKTQPSRERGE